MHFAWDDSRRAFAEAATWFGRMVALAGGRWDEPGLGEWDVRSLVGHTSRALLTVEQYLASPAATVEIATPTDYYRRTRGPARGLEVAERGRVAGAALGEDPASVLPEIVARVLALVEDSAGSQLLTTIAGGMRLADYLPTRTFELVVHTCDLATALGRAMPVPPTAGAQALGIVIELAIDDGLAGPLLLAATGRSTLPPGFSVL